MTSTERRLEPLGPPVSSRPADEEPSPRPYPVDTYRRSVLSRSSHRGSRRTRSTIQLGSFGEQEKRRSTRLSVQPARALPALRRGTRKSSLQPPKVSVFRDGEFFDRARAGLKSAPAGSSHLGPAEEVSPSIYMLQELRHATSLPRLSRVHPEDEDEETTIPPVEHSSWMSSTLASLPSKRKGLPPLQEVAKPHERKAAPTQEGASDAKADQQASRPKSKERALGESPSGSASDMPSAQEVLNRLTSGAEGFSRTEMQRMTQTFRRFTVPGTRAIEVKDLRSIMQHLGYMMTDEETIKEIAGQVTQNHMIEQHAFVSFAENLTKHENRRFKEIFDTFDEDGSGRLDLAELRKFMVAIGFTPLRAMLREAMELVNADGADSIGFNEMLHLLAIYRHTEGFTNNELKDLHSLFSKAKSDDSHEVSAAGLKDVLQGFYGPQSSMIAKWVGAEINKGPENKGVDQADDAQTSILGMKLPETLIWARRLREAEIQVWREKFLLYDQDGSNSMDLGELTHLLRDLGYTLTKSTIEEAMHEAEDEYSGKKEGHLDFDEFVNIVFIVRGRDGFSEAEVSELSEAFHRFLRSGSQEVDGQSLCAILRYMGHNTFVDEVQRITSTAGIDTTSGMDFRHFQWFMRLHREEELQKVQKVFQKYEEQQLQGVPTHSIPTALAELGCVRGHSQQQVIQKAMKAFPSQPAEDANAADFNRFVEMVDACRADRVAQQRRMAGFSDGELQHFRQLFEQFDIEGTGIIGLIETGAILEELGFTMKTPFDRERFLISVEKAREAAQKVGVEDIGDDCLLSFWVVVQLLRVILSRDEQSVMDREANAIAYTKFGAKEVHDFKDIFTSCLSQAQGAESEELLMTRAITGDDSVGGAKELSKDSVRGLLRSLGMSLDAESRSRLDNKIDELNSMGRVDFADFLRLMQWMLETNFADIQGSAAQVVTKQSGHSAAG